MSHAKTEQRMVGCSLLLLVVFHSLRRINQVGEAALAAVLPVVVIGHEDASPADFLKTFPLQPVVPAPPPA